jgi:hypothetical protein
MYCNAASKSCSLFPKCSSIDGSAPNTVLPCQCGSSACAFTGQPFCLAEYNACHEFAGTHHYVEIDTGTCGSVANHGSLADMASCEAGKAGLSLDVGASYEYNLGNDPSGCYTKTKLPINLIFCSPETNLN